MRHRETFSQNHQIVFRTFENLLIHQKAGQKFSQVEKKKKNSILKVIIFNHFRSQNIIIAG